MHATNIFEGESYAAQMAIVVYSQLMKGSEVSYESVRAEYEGGREMSSSIACYEHYGDLKKAFMHVRKALLDKLPGSIEESGNNRHKTFRYVGTDSDPLADLRNAAAIRDLRSYWDFCQDSAGLMPMSWLEHYFRNTRDLLEIKRSRSRGTRVISTDERSLHNIEMLPIFYDAIKRKEVLSVTYKAFDQEPEVLTFHPHHLKEFNGRWHVYGFAEGKRKKDGFGLPLDRIEGAPTRVEGKYIAPTPGFYESSFRQRIGVSHSPKNPVETVRIRAYGKYFFGLITTKYIHESQQVVTPLGVYDGEEYGEVEITVEINNEFFGRIFHMGENLEVVSPQSVRDMFKDRVRKLNNRYSD